jgi:hypothetical protein
MRFGRNSRWLARATGPSPTYRRPDMEVRPLPIADGVWTL